jgi:hypothetical protein
MQILRDFLNQSRMHGRQTVLFYQRGASPTVYFYGLLAKCDQPLALLFEKTRRYNRGTAPEGIGPGFPALDFP